MSDPFAPQANARQPDSTYLAALEKRLKAVKNKEQIDSKTILKDIKSLKNDQLFNFLTEPEKPTTSWETFDDDSLPEDKPIKPSIIRQKVAPQTCAINKNELAHILKYDLSQKLFDFYNQLDESQTDREESQEILQELKELANTPSPTKKRKRTKKRRMNERKLAKNRSRCAFRLFKRDHAFYLFSNAKKSKATNWFLQKRRGTSSSFEKSLRLHTLPNAWWESAEYLRSDQITVVVSFDGNIALTTDKQCRKSKWKMVNLVKLLPMEPENRGSLYELGCCDLSLECSGDCLAILAVFWTELNTNNVPAKCFGSIYRITKKRNVVFCKIISSPSMVACCRLTDRKSFTADHHCLLVFSKDAQVSAYRVEPTFIEKIDDVFEWFPSLALTNLPGGTLRTSCKICQTYRYSAVGLDTGVIIASVCEIEGNVILDSIRLRFFSPISVVEFLPEVSNNVQRLLVSSFVGPGQIYRLKFANDKLSWEEECKFERAQYYDSITCACIYRFYHGAVPRVLFGTYSGRVLQYELPPPTTFVRKSMKNVPKCGKPINLLINNPIYNIKQTNFNEFSVVTPFGLYVIRENFATSKRLGKFGQLWVNRYQNKLLLRNPSLASDYSRSELRRLSIDSINELAMRPRVGSTVSQLTYRFSDDDGLLDRTEKRRQTLGAKDYQRGATTSASGSSNGSTTRLRQLDVTITDQYYQDGPSDSTLLHSPNRPAPSPRVNAIHESSHPQSPLAHGDSTRPQPVFFRAINKNLTSPSRPPQK